MIFLGIDPGAGGGLAVIDTDGTLITVTRMPETDADIWAFFDDDLLRPRENVRAVIERVRSSPQMGVVSVCSFCGNYRALRMALTAAGISFDEVVPLVWQRSLGCLSGGDKNVTKARAQQVFPAEKITHATADALLLATYAGERSSVNRNEVVMAKSTTVRLGFEVGSGTPVDIPIRHMAVTGQTQEAGKTTALEALIMRSGLNAVTFITKRGEGSFKSVQVTQQLAYFKERADWQFVGSLIDATLGEKNKILRSWLMKVCRNTKTLAEVRDNVRAAKAKARLGFDESILTQIEGYLDLVIPQLADLPKVARGTLELRPGLNVFDLTRYSPEIQGLVIRSVIEHVYEHEANVITVIPEAWEFLPEGRGSPVKLAAETLIRKGAALGNYMWVDAQDLGGLWKTVVRACAVNLVGVQREANEVKRTLANLPASTPRLKPAEIATLGLGQFYACYGNRAVRTYVMPAWLHEHAARLTAQGVKPPAPGIHFLGDEQTTHTTKSEATRQRRAAKEELVTKDEAKALVAENGQLRSTVEALKGDIRRMQAQLEAAAKSVPARVGGPASWGGGVLPDNGSAVTGAGGAPAGGAGAAVPGGGREWTATQSLDNEAMYQAIKARLMAEAVSDPVLLKVLVSRPEIALQRVRQTITATADDLRGRLALLLAEGWFDSPKKGTTTATEMGKRGWAHDHRNVSKALDTLSTMGFCRIESDGYQAVPGMKVNIIET